VTRDDEIRAFLDLLARVRGNPQPRFMELPWIERAAWLHTHTEGNGNV
jgi:hypothetical protein